MMVFKFGSSSSIGVQFQVRLPFVLRGVNFPNRKKIQANVHQNLKNGPYQRTLPTDLTLSKLLAARAVRYSGFFSGSVKKPWVNSPFGDFQQKIFQADIKVGWHGGLVGWHGGLVMAWRVGENISKNFSSTLREYTNCPHQPTQRTQTFWGEMLGKTIFFWKPEKFKLLFPGDLVG